MATKLGKNCPFCGQPLTMDTYCMRGRGYAPTLEVFCDNDNCDIKPSSGDQSPSAAFADVNAWGGHIPNSEEER